MVKRSRSRAAAASLLAVSIALAAAEEPQAGSASGKSPPASLPAEAPASLFSATLGGAEAELLVRGSWQAGLAAAAGLQARSGGGLVLSPSQPLLFTQHPDLFLTFLLFKKVFVEARVSDDPTEARYSVGYRGGADEPIKEARVGNDKISFPTLPFMSFGNGSYRSFGAAGTGASGNFTGHAMLRYDQADRVTKRFVGSSEVTDAVIAASAFVSGRYFATGGRPVSGLAVYVQSSAGSLAGDDGNRYRRLDSGEYGYSAATGFIALKEAAATRVLALYAGSGTLSDRVSIPGVGTCDLLYDPEAASDGSRDPKLQVLSRYSTAADPESSEAFVRSTGSGLRDSSFEARIDSGGFVEVVRAGGSASPADPTYARPFAGLPAAMDWLYTTDFSSDAVKSYAPVFTREIVVRSFKPTEYISVDKDVVSGSVEVTRNGVPDYAFSLDAENGRLTLASPPGLAEEIVVTYLRETAERRAGSIAAAIGGSWDLGDGASAWTALGLRWAVPGTSYAKGGTSDPGVVTFTAGEKAEKGSLKHKIAAAARYTKADASGRYRIESMEDSGSYASSFRPSATLTGASVAEMADDGLAKRFPTLADELHRDGSTQRALRILSTGASDVSIQKVEALPPYADFTSLVFFARSTALSGTLDLTLDEGPSSSLAAAAVSVSIPLGSLSDGEWKRFVVKYGDSAVYVQNSERGGLSRIATLAAPFDSSTTASRILIEASGLAQGQEIWVDEILLEGAVGRAALLFQGELSYADPSLRIGPSEFPLVSGLDVKADAAGAYQEGSFASGGLSARTALGPLGVGAHARASAGEGARPALRGGHELAFPLGRFPIRGGDVFDFDPATGAFGRENTVSANAWSLASVDLKQKTTWSAAASPDESGLLDQSWEGKLSLAGGLAGATAAVRNRARPSAWRDLSPAYGNAWRDAYAYAVPAFVAEAERREERIGLTLGGGKQGEVVSASIGLAARPNDAGGASRSDDATAKLSLPLAFGTTRIAPYYKRTWKDQRDGTAGSLEADARRALADLSRLRFAYTAVPFAELADSTLPSRFADASTAGSLPLPSASYAPEAGLVLSRGFGSYWYDLLVPSSLSLARRRELAREDSAVTDTRTWELNAKFAAINLFGTSGSRPIGLPFESDEYLVSIQAALAEVAGESSPRLKLTSQHLATLYASGGDRLDAENRASIATVPSSRTWTESCRLALSRREARHWLLDLYRMALPPGSGDSRARRPAAQAGTGSESVAAGSEPASAASGSEGDAGPVRPSLASMYLEDLVGRVPVMRSILEVKAEVSGSETDAARPSPTWGLVESYEAKLTVPERLTASAKGSFSQGRDGSARVTTFDLTLTLSITISF